MPDVSSKLTVLASLLHLCISLAALSNHRRLIIYFVYTKKTYTTERMVTSPYMQFHQEDVALPCFTSLTSTT